MFHLVIVVCVCIFGLVRLVYWLLRPLGLHRIRKRGATKPVRSFHILSLGLFNPPPSLTRPRHSKEAGRHLASYPPWVTYYTGLQH